MLNKYHNIENRILKVVKSLTNYKKPNIINVNCKCCVPLSRLKNC